MSAEVVTPEHTVIVTQDGDVVPIVDEFVTEHPDFSIDGAKGTIAVTGFEGVLGYRTEAEDVSTSTVNSSTAILQNAQHRINEIDSAKKVVARLKETGWNFASHSYTHEHAFQIGTISLAQLKDDTERWIKEVGSIVGPTDIYVGPFGQVFSDNDPRRSYLESRGFDMFCGVGIDGYLKYSKSDVVMDRADIDGYRLSHTPERLKSYLNTEETFGM